MRKEKHPDLPLLVTSLNRFICDYFGISKEEFESPAHSYRITRARFWAWYVLRFEYGVSYPRIAKFYNRHHTSIMNGAQWVKTHAETAPVIEGFKTYLFLTKNAELLSPNTSTSNPQHDDQEKPVVSPYL